MDNYFDSHKKNMCFGCEACVQTCPKKAIIMIEDKEGFRYPKIDKAKCINCGLCRKICPHENMPKKYDQKKYVFGGYHKNYRVRDKSTSGGAFSAIVSSFSNKDYVIFGATSDGLNIYHDYTENKKNIDKFRKSKYSQSKIGDSYIKVKQFLKEDKKVLFSGTPCQIAGLKSYLRNINTDNLLTVEVICEGVPSPLYVRKLEEHLYQKYNFKIKNLDYRYTDIKTTKKSYRGKWDFQIMHIEFTNGKKIKKDRWINPYWNIWLNHLMSRPACYKCPFTTVDRLADITLGDLWGVHLYCPELYGHNGGASLVICNTEKGKDEFKKAEKYMYGHELKFEDALKYQGPLRKPIAMNDKRNEFMKDLSNKETTYKQIVKKWYQKPCIKLLWSKYVWGNRQKVFMWGIMNKNRK